jgi:hypothetical protein
VRAHRVRNKLRANLAMRDLQRSEQRTRFLWPCTMR